MMKTRGCMAVVNRWSATFPLMGVAYAPSVDLMILGPFDVGGPAGPVLLGATKQRLLLALLAVRANEVVSAAQLIDGLWGEDPPPTALKTVHGHVARVRRILESAGLTDALVTREPGYFLRVDPQRIDAVRFEQHAEAGRRALAEGDAVNAERELAVGLGLWRGDALADCRDDSEVIMAAAVRLDELRMGAIEDHMDAQLALGRHAAIIGDLESMLTRHQLRERLWCLLLVALYRSQRQAEALRAYQRARAALVESLGVEPSAELRRLEAAILQGDPSLDLAPTSSPASTPASSSTRLVGWSTSGPAFVGRDVELSALTERWERARGGERQIVMISGEPGIGKTRLAAEVAVVAQGDGASVLYGRCDEDLGVPYQPFVEALRGYAATCTDRELAGSLGRYPGELVRLVPEIESRMSGLAPPLRSDPATEQYRLFEAVVEWLVTASQTAPLVLVVDDLHWGAQPTVLLLRHVMCSERSGRLLVLGTYRQSELDRRHPLTQMLADTHVNAPTASMQRLELRGLDAPSVASFVEDAAGYNLGDTGRRFARTVHVETAGNPFFVAEIVRSLMESGRLGPGPLDDKTPGNVWPEDLRIPAAARDVVLRRVARLSEDAQHVLTLAAVVGAEFEVEVLEDLADLDVDALLVALEDATVARLIDEAGVNRFSFAHAITRSALYDRLSASRRVRLHGRVADALERVHANDLSAHLSALAYHYADAKPEKAVRYAIDAANGALDRLAFEDAVNICRRGLAAVERAHEAGAPVAPTEECDLLLALGKAELSSGQHGRTTLLRAYEVARALGDEHRQAASVLAVNRGFFSRIGRIDRELVAALEHAIDAQSTGDTPELAELLAVLASELVWAPDPERCVELSDRALAMARDAGNTRTLARVLLLRNLTIGSPDSLSQRVAECDELLSIAEELRDPALKFQAAFHRSGTAMEAGNVDAANAMVELAGQLAQELHQPSLLFLTSMMRTARRILEGALDEAERGAYTTFELGQQANQGPEALIFFTELLLEIRRWQGRLPEMLPEFRDLVAVEGVDFGHSLVRYLYDAGEHEQAIAHYHEIMRRQPVPPRRDLLAGATLCNLAYLAARAVDTTHAPRIYDALSPLAGSFANTTVAKPVTEHYLGMLAASLQEIATAEAHFAVAIAAHEKARAPLLVAETQVEWARLLVGSGADPERAAGLIGAASAAATTWTAGFLQRSIEELRSRRPKASAPVPSPPPRGRRQG
jgi:DNA-binding SARP family transcriptional activator/tetratricopeptide (TPR) repeat protein